MNRKLGSSASSASVIGALLLAMVVLAFGLAACGDGWGQDGSRAVSEMVSGDWIRVYFTSPRYPDDDAYHHGGLDEELAAVIEQAETSVDLAAYDLDLERVTSALIAAHRDGVRVRVVTESDNAHEDAITNLQQAGIPVVEDGHDWGLMHNKFAVIDGQWVWTDFLLLQCRNSPTPRSRVTPSLSPGLWPDA